jgi:hypothetical protein
MHIWLIRSVVQEMIVAVLTTVMMEGLLWNALTVLR